MKYLLSLLFIFYTILHADNLTAAKELFDVKEKYSEAIMIFEKNQDNPEAVYYLGKAYYYGLGVEKDTKKAFEYAKKSADSKFPAGLNLLGVLYQYGDDTTKDETKVFALYSEAANLGNTKAMNNLGWIYATNSFVKKDIEKARLWFMRSIEHGNNEGYINLGHLYTDEKNYPEALKWIFKYEELEPNKFKVSYYFRIAFLYMHLQQYENAYKYFLKATQLGSFEPTFNLYRMIKDGHISKSKTEEAIYWLEQASNPSKNKTGSLNLSQELLYIYYLDDSNQSKKALELAEFAYQNGNIQLGCYLASQYGNTLDKNFDLHKSFDIATKIISENGASIQTSSCYSSLAFMYQRGDYVAKDTLKYIELTEKIFNEIYDKKNDLFSVWIAESYMKDFHDFENAKKWYQISYNLTKDTKYLTKVDEYKKTLPIFDETTPKKEQALFPIINNLSKAEQIASVLETEKYYFLATDQKSINVYDKKTLTFIKELRGWIGSGMEGMTIQMAFDENKELLYCARINSERDLSVNDNIIVFDISKGNIVKTLQNKKSIKSMYLNISKDGKYLISINNRSLLQIIDTSTNQDQFYDFSNKVNFSLANIEKTSDDYIAKVLGNDGNLYSFSVNLKRQISKEPFKNQTTFKSFNGAHAQNIFKSSNNDIVGVQFKNNELFIKTSSNKSHIFNIENLTLSTTNKPMINSDLNSNLNIIVKSLNENRTLEIYQNNKKISTIEFLFLNALSYQIIEDKYIVVTTSDISTMYIFNLQGRAIASLRGFLSLQKNIIYQNGYLITYGDDNMFHLWNIDNLDQHNQTKEVMDQEVLRGVYKLSRGNILEILEDNRLDDKFFELQVQQNGWNFKATKEQIKLYMKMVLSKKEEIYPLASLYIDNDDWIVFDHNGLFASSPNGTDLIRYHQNQGFDKEARIVKNSQIFEKFYRPDLIKKKLTKEQVDIDLDIASVIAQINPPEVVILKKKMLDSNTLEVTYKVCDRGSGVSGATLLINGISITPAFTRGFRIESIPNTDDNCTLNKIDVTLKSGVNSIEFKAFDASKTISAKSNAITGTGQGNKDSQSNLYFVSIAVSDYEDRLLKLNFPVNDVLAVKEKIEKKSKVLFKNIYTFTLHDNNATKDKLDSLFTNLSKKIKTDDVLVVYFAGHGSTNDKDGLYYFYPYNLKDISYVGLKKDAISVNDIKTQLSKTQAYNSLILFDTCSSGGVIDSVLESQMVHRLSQDNRRNFIAASSNDKPAYEGYKGHGVFTYAVLEAFNQAYSPTQTKLTTTNLAEYVKILVPKITFENWHYEQTPQAYLNGDEFEIGVK